MIFTWVEQLLGPFLTSFVRGWMSGDGSQACRPLGELLAAFPSWRLLQEMTDGLSSFHT